MDTFNCFMLLQWQLIKHSLGFKANLEFTLPDLKLSNKDLKFAANFSA